jgi:hypothetical protein
MDTDIKHILISDGLLSCDTFTMKVTKKDDNDKDQKDEEYNCVLYLLVWIQRSMVWIYLGGCDF